MTADMLTPDEAKLLLSLCRDGKLYEVERWIGSGKSLLVSPELKTTPLQVAIDRGFHSLVELLARNETSQQAKNAALADAVARRNLEYVQLLLDRGAEIRTVPLADVLLTWEPKLIRFFLDNGADVLSGSPFAEAFASKIRTALRPFVEYKKTHPHLADQLQEQADSALRYFCHEGNLKWISLLMWAGASPRTKGPKYGEQDDPECYTNGLSEACYSGNVEVLKKLKPQPGQDDIAEMLGRAAALGRTEAIRYLLGLGAKPNDKPNGGSSALDRCIWHLNFEGWSPYKRYRPKAIYEVRQTLEMVRLLAEHGAVWKPDGASEMNWLRRTLYECEPSVTVELLKILRQHQSCSEETIRELLRTPRMQQHLSPDERKLSRIGVHVGPQVKRNSPGNPSPRDSERKPISHALMNRYNREQLYKEAWSQPMQKLAIKYEISDVALAKVCRKLYVPLPGRGYWAKKAAGKPVPKKPPLPALGGGSLT